MMSEIVRMLFLAYFAAVVLIGMLYPWTKRYFTKRSFLIILFGFLLLLFYSTWDIYMNYVPSKWYVKPPGLLESFIRATIGTGIYLFLSLVLFLFGVITGFVALFLHELYKRFSIRIAKMGRK